MQYNVSLARAEAGVKHAERKLTRARSMGEFHRAEIEAEQARRRVMACAKVAWRCAATQDGAGR